MKKLKLIATGNDGNRSFYSIKKEASFFSFFKELMEKLDIENYHLRNAYDEYGEDDIMKYVDVVDRVKDGTYDIDIIYGHKNIILIVRSELNINHTFFANEINKIAEW